MANGYTAAVANRTGNLKTAKRSPGRDANQQLSELLSRAQEGERTVVRRGNKRVAAVVPIEDFDFLEEIEDRMDIEAAMKSLNQPGGIKWEDLKKELGL